MTTDNPQIDAPVMFRTGGLLIDGENIHPDTFTVFSPDVEMHDAIAELIRKSEPLVLVDGKTEGAATGTFSQITNWQQFADLPLDDQVKMNALLEAIADDVINIINELDMASLIKDVWAPQD